MGSQYFLISISTFFNIFKYFSYFLRTFHVYPLYLTNTFHLLSKQLFDTYKVFFKNFLDNSFRQRWKNVQGCRQCLCKICPSLGKICANFVLLFIAIVSYVVILRFLGNTYGFFTLKRGNNLNNFIIVASKDVWQSYCALTCCQIHFTLFCY